MTYIPALVERASPTGTFNGTPPDHLPAENGVHVWRAAVAMPFVTFFFVALRFYTRIYILKAKKLTIDDCMSPVHDSSIAMLIYDRYCGLDDARLHRPLHPHGHRHIQRNGLTYMAIRLRT